MPAGIVERLFEMPSTTPENIIERVVGLEVRVKHVEGEIETVIDRLDAMHGTVGSISTAVAEIRSYTKGAWLVLQVLAWAIGILVAGVGAYVAIVHS